MPPRYAAALVLVLVLTQPFSLAGCATKKEFVATGGSRADGTVSLSYNTECLNHRVKTWKKGTRWRTQRVPDGDILVLSHSAERRNSVMRSMDTATAFTGW